MIANERKKQLIEIALFEFQIILDELRREYAPSNNSGIPPQELFVEQNERISERFAIQPDEILGKWLITTRQVQKLPDEKARPTPGLPNGIFYECGLGYFMIDDETQMVALGWQVGPRFGRGYSYKIEAQGQDQLKLIKAEMIWLS